MLGDKKTALPLICREKLHDALLKIIQTEKKEDVYLVLNSDRKEGTKYNFVSRQWNIVPVCLPYSLFMTMAKFFKTIGILKMNHY